MKIRVIELNNLRRFAGQRARITGIGDGVSVLSQPNEFGKSTFFDGLHALFFQPHRSTRAPVKALKPHVGGAPGAAVEVDLPEGRFRIEKQWLSRPAARVLDAAGRLIAQEDEAEAWIDRLTGQGLAGPSGLLWVRQGLLGLEPEGTSAAEKAEREQGLAVRRDLLSSVAGEIEMMTGGRRMDQVLTRLNETLGQLATTTLRPRSGGDWARAVDDAAALAGQRASLEVKAARLGSDLRRRAAILRDLVPLTDAEATARDERALSDAVRALDLAESHAEHLGRAAGELRLAQMTALQGQEAIRGIADLQGRLDAAVAAERLAQEELSRAEAQVQEAALLESQADATAQQAQASTGGLAARLDRVRRAQLSLAARDRAARLAGDLDRAERQRHALEVQRARRSLLRITAPLLAAAEKAQTERDRLIALIEARQVSLRFDYDGLTRARVDGREIGAGSLRLQGISIVDLPGIGRMTVNPGLSDPTDTRPDLPGAELRLTRALAACGAPGIIEARAALAEAQALETSIAQAQALLSELAPDGIEALQVLLAEARDAAEAGRNAEDQPNLTQSNLGQSMGPQAGDELSDRSRLGSDTGPDLGADLPQDDPAVLEQELGAARGAEAQAQTRRQEAQTRHATLRESRAARQAAAQGTGRQLAVLRAEAGDPTALAERLAALVVAQEGLSRAEGLAARSHQALRDSAPDLDTARATVARLRSVVEGRQRDRSRLEQDLAGVNGSVGALAEEGIEEDLNEIRGREEAALARAARYEREVQALARLRMALDLARREARDAYFGPVLRELDPLLSILHPGAALHIDDTSLLPAILSRDGQDESFDILSGGTREQLAILTRLAFARLFARAGRAVPVILDDALVHSDDDRIEAMFTALHRVAQDQQIIVLTCRGRAFAPLGGERLRVEVTAL